MCGILGITEKNETLIRRAAETFAYRGPDASVVVADEHVTLGHNRLSIIDLDPRANQPMSDVDDKLLITYNGEIYNFQEIRTELESKGYSFRTSSDTEVLLSAYREWGAQMVERLRGMYAFAIYDKEHNTVVLVTDYAAMKPIFYCTSGRTFMFASEIKGILSMLRQKEIKPAIDYEALDLYWTLGYVSSPKTIFQGISRMPRRSILTVDLKDGSYIESFYQAPKSVIRSDDELKVLIEKKVETHLIADVPVGLFFSGGTDSSLIACVLKKLGITLEAFSLEIDQRPEDRKYFDAIAKHLTINIHSSFFGPTEFDSVYQEVTERIDEPLADSSMFPTYFIAREAAKHVKVVLSGEGGDEYFLGYPRSLVLSRMHSARLDAGVSMLDLLYVFTPSFRGKVPLFVRLFTFFKQPLSYYVLTTTPTAGFVGLRQWRLAKRSLAALHSDPVSLDADFYLENDLLRKLDLATMYNSIEGRTPLLDPDVCAAAQVAMKPLLPLTEKKPLLKKILATYLPRELVYRGKRGFGLDASAFFSRSQFLREDLSRAIQFLNGRGLVPPKRPPPIDFMVSRRPQMCWQILMLYHALKNAGV